MARSFLPDSLCCPCMQPMGVSRTVKYMSRGLPGVGGTNTGGFKRYCFILSKANWQSSVHSVGAFFLSNLNSGSQVEVN